jgi:hypothetical protein
LQPYVKPNEGKKAEVKNLGTSKEVLGQSYLTMQTDGASSFQMSPSERRQTKYHMNNDRVVGFYKKVLTDLRTTI